MKDWVTEIQDRMKDAGNACAVLELCESELRSSIRKDIKLLEYVDELPGDLKVKQELVAELEDVLRVCREHGEYCEMRFEQKMEGDISRLERMK